MKSGKRMFTRTLVGAAVFAALGFAGSAVAQQTVKIGLLATLEGPFAAGGQDGMRGAEMAVQASATAWSPARRSRSSRRRRTRSPTSRSTRRASSSSRTRCDIMVGPLSGGEGIAVKDYAKTQPNITFINGSSGAQGDHAGQPGGELLPLQHRRRAVDVRARQGGAREGLQADDGDRRGLRVPVLAGAGLHDRVLQGGRQGSAEGMGAARRQGLRVGDRAHPEGRRCAARRARRRGRGELPQPVRAGGRRQADRRRFDHREPGRAELPRQATRVAARHAVGGSGRRRVRRAGVEEVRRRLQGELQGRLSDRRRCSRTSTTRT